MPKVVFRQPCGSETRVDVPVRTSVMRAAVDHGVPKIIGECGGELACATCHVFVDPEWFDRLAPANDDELAMLQVTSEEPTQYSRLSCQIAVVEDLDGLIVNVPETQR